MRGKIWVVILIVSLFSCVGLGSGFQSEKETSDFIAKNIQVKTDFSKTAIKISAIPKKVVVGGFNVRYFLITPNTGSKVGSIQIDTSRPKAEMFVNMKPQGMALMPLIVKSFINNFKSSKIEIMPIETASTSKSYQESQYKSEIAVKVPFDPEGEYASYDSYFKIPAASLKFLYGGDVPKKLFPALRKETGADGVLWINISLFRSADFLFFRDEIKMGDCRMEIYAPAKSDKDPDFMVFSANLKSAGVKSKIIMKKNEWKNKDNKEKAIEEYWPIFGKWFDDLFTSYSYLVDQSIK